MNWFARKTVDIATNRQRKEILVFLESLCAADGDELGLMIACATHVRHTLEKNGNNLLDPIALVLEQPYFCYTLSKTVIALQKQNKFVAAAGMSVWVHTLRAAAAPELRVLGRAVWRELQRGFAHVRESTDAAGKVSGERMNISGFDIFPIGFIPSVL